MRNLLSFQLLFPIVKLFHAFKILNLSLVLSLTALGWGMDFFGFIVFGFCPIPWICTFMGFVNLGKFSVNNSSNTFQLHTCLFLSRTLMTWMLDMCYTPKGLQSSFQFFFNLFSLCCSDGVLSIVLSSISQILSPSVFILFCSPYSDVFVFVS